MVRSVLLALGFFSALTPVASQTIVIENFSSPSLPDWTVGQISGGYSPTVVNNWLRLTTAGTSEATYAVYNTSFASANTSVYADFLFRTYDGTGADGISFFLYDASQTFQAGAFGGSLGYAQKVQALGAEADIAGMAGGYLAIGIDEYGNFSNPTEGRVGGPGFLPSAVAVRGNEGSNYQYLGGTGALSTSLWSNSSTAPTSGAGYGHVILSISPTGQLTVALARDSTSAPATILSMNVGTIGRPENLRFGFTGSTGASTAIHEIGALTLASVPAHVWDRGSGTSAWGTADNWNPATVPFAEGDVLFDNSNVSTAQAVDVGTGETRTVRTVFIDAPFNYTISNGTINFSGGSAISTSGIMVTDNKGAGATQHSVNSAITMANAIELRNTSTAQLYLGGTISNNGNLLTVGGTGDVTLAGAVSGSGGLFKSGSNALNLNAANTYTGTTEVNQGVLKLGASDRLSDSSNLTLSGGTINLNGFSEQVNNLNFSNNGTIDFGTTGTTNYFLFNGISGSPSGVITIDHWESATDILAAQTSLSADVLNQFYFSGTGTGAVQLGTSETIGSYGGGWLRLNPVSATWFTWDGSSSSNWGTAANWDTSSVPPSGAKVAFGTATQSSRRNVNLQANRTVNAIRFDAGGSGSYNVGNNNSSYTLTMGGTGTAFIQQKSNTYSQTISAPLALANNTVIDMIGTKNLTVSGAMSGSGNLVKEGTGGKLQLSGNNASYAGNIYINAGTILISHSNALGNTTGKTVIADGATLQLSNNITSAENIEVDGVGASSVGVINNLSGSNTLSGTITLTDAALLSANSGTTMTVSGDILSMTGRDLTLGGVGNIVVSGSISTGSGEVTKTGSGMVTLSGDNSFIGSLNIAQGTVRLGASERLSSSGSVVMTAGTFNLNNYDETIGSLSGTGSVTLGTGTLSTGANNSSTTFAGMISGGGNLTKTGSGTFILTGSNSYSGLTTIDQGTLRLGANNVLSNLTEVSISSGATFDVDGRTETIARLTGAGAVSLGAGALSLGDATHFNFGGSIIGTGTLTKLGTGTLTINSNVDFDGTVLVSAGTLELTAGASIETLSLASGTTLRFGGSGTTYNITNLTISGTSTIDFGSGSVTIDVGTLTTNGSVVLNVNNWTDIQDWFFTSNWVKDGITYTWDAAPSRGQIPLNQAVFSGYNGSNTAWLPINGQGHGNITPVPEPTTYGAIFLGLTLGLLLLQKWIRRRRTPAVQPALQV